MPFQKGHKAFKGTEKTQFKKGQKPYNKGLKGYYHNGSFKKGHKSYQKIGEENSNWKGDKVKYGGLHDWVRKRLGKPKYCAYCQTTTAKKYEWANMSKTYKRDLSDWIRLCSFCHKAFDLGKIHL